MKVVATQAYHALDIFPELNMPSFALTEFSQHCIRFHFERMSMRNVHWAFSFAFLVES